MRIFRKHRIRIRRKSKEIMDDEEEINRELILLDEEENIPIPGAVAQEEERADSSSSSDEEGAMGVNGSRRSHGERAEEDPADPGEGASSQNDQKRNKTVNFNRTLPAIHAYLGRDMEDVGVGSQNVFEDNAVVEGIPLFPVPNLILMPGQTLPLQSLHPRAISMFRAIIARSQMFGVVNVNYAIRGANIEEGLSTLGTLTQVLAYKETTDHEITSLKLRAVGRERFQILETQRQIDGTLVGKVKILPEIVLGNPLIDVQLPSIRSMHAAGSRVCFQKSASRKQDSKYFASAFTPWPWFVYKQYDIDDVIRQIKTELNEWYDPHRVEQLSKLPVDFSYWVASNLPLSNEMKLRVLGINCVLQRLRCELSLIKKFTILVCRECNAKIGDKVNLFSMSLDGPIGAFVNPHGYVHETITLTAAESINEVGIATTENTWFPGYAWKIINCAQCGDHLGWKFAARRRQLRPAEFYGISRAAVLPSRDETVPTPDDDNEESLPCM